MAHLTRNDSSSIISSLQMDYGDSDEEDNLNSSRNTSNQEPPETEIGVPHFTSEEANNGETATMADTDHTSAQNDRVTAVTESVEDPPQGSGASTEMKINSAPEVSPVDFISDDEEGGHHHHRDKQKHGGLDGEKRLALAEAVSVDSPSSQGSAGAAARKATRLVSYGPDEDLDESESESEEEQDMQESSTNSPEEDLPDPASLSRSVQNLSGDAIQIPPEPPGRCSTELQDKIISMHGRMAKEGMDLNRVIQSKKNFRNPSIYEKLIDFCQIDEKGTNFPPEIYDPHIWGKESFYDELDKVQRKDMERREKEKKDRTKIEFLTGTKKSSAPLGDNSGVSEEKKRKTKWDAQPSGISTSVLKAPGVQGPGIVNLTATATGTKATVISAVGSLGRKGK